MVSDRSGRLPHGDNGASSFKWEVDPMLRMRIESGESVQLETLGLTNKSTTATPLLEMANTGVDRLRSRGFGRHLGSGADKDVFLYGSEFPTEYGGREIRELVIGIGQTQPNLRTAVYRIPTYVALYARMANAVSNPDELLAMVEQGHSIQREVTKQQRNGGRMEFHYSLLKERFPGKEAITDQNLMAFNMGVALMCGGVDRTEPKTFSYARPQEYEGGLVGYLNYIATYVKSLNPDLQISPKFFPEVYLFGVWGQKDVAGRAYMLPALAAEKAKAIAESKGKPFTPNLQARYYMTVEKYNTSLADIYEEGFEHMSSGKTRDERIGRMLEFVNNTVPVKAILEMRNNLTLLHALGFGLGDLKIDSLVFKKSGKEWIGMYGDPGLVRLGKRVMFYTEDYLPNMGEIPALGALNPKAAGRAQVLSADPELDKYAFNKATGIIVEPFKDPKKFDVLLAEYRKLVDSSRYER